MPPGRVALFHWGDTIEDFLDGIGLDLTGFRTGMSSGWMFGYVEALATAGIETVIVVVSRELKRTERWRHPVTGALMIGVPEPRAHRVLNRRLRDAYAADVKGAAANGRRAGRAAGAVAWNLHGYCATPVRAVARELRKMGCAAILCQEYESPRFDVLVALGAALRLPVFATFQGGNAHYAPLERLVRPRTMARSRGFVIASDTEAQRVPVRYGVAPDAIARIPNPLDTGFWAPDPADSARAALGIGPGQPLVAWHGRLAMNHKGLDVLLDAWARVEGQSPPDEPPVLLLVGDGPDADRVRATIRRLNLGNVIFERGYVLDHELVRRYLRSADLYVMPSRHEGFAVAPLEALACGLPIVATDVSGVREILADGRSSGGLVVPSEDPGALASAIGTLVGDRALRDRMGADARRHVERAFSLPAVGRRLAEFFAGGGARFV